MRHIQSCILQLLVDADQPSSLRGRLSMDREGEEWSFRNREESMKRLAEKEHEEEDPGPFRSPENGGDSK